MTWMEILQKIDATFSKNDRMEIFKMICDSGQPYGMPFTYQEYLDKVKREDYVGGDGKAYTGLDSEPSTWLTHGFSRKGLLLCIIRGDADILEKIMKVGASTTTDVVRGMEWVSFDREFEQMQVYLEPLGAAYDELPLLLGTRNIHVQSIVHARLEIGK